MGKAIINWQLFYMCTDTNPILHVHLTSGFWFFEYFLNIKSIIKAINDAIITRSDTVSALIQALSDFEYSHIVIKKVRW